MAKHNATASSVDVRGLLREQESSDLVLIKVPVAGEARDPLFRLDMGKLSERHRNTLNRIWQALRNRHAVLNDGRHVESVPDAVRWMLDQVENGAA